MDEGSWVRASYVIDRNGMARNVQVEDAGGGSELARNVAKSMPRWRFEPESIAGTPIETAVRQEFVFYAHDRQPPALPPCPPDATGRVLAPGQTSCHYRVEHVKTGETRMGRTITVP